MPRVWWKWVQCNEDSLKIFQLFKLVFPTFLARLFHKFKVPNAHGHVTGHSGFEAQGDLREA
jgi:hypothetical protein